MPEAVFTTKQVAERLGVDQKTVLRYLRSGRLKGSKLAKDWRISESAVSRLLASEPPRASRAGQATVTAVVNQKGGVGKTTTTYNLGSALQRLGKRVLLIDLDPQAALTTYAGIFLPNVTVSVYQILLDDNVDPLSVIRETPSGVHVLPSNIDLSAAEIELVSMISREQVLKDSLEKLLPRYDHILIDCPPSLGLLTVNALAAADQVIIPLQCEFLATRGLNLLLRTLDKIRARLNRELRVAGILATMFDGRTTHANEVLTELRASFPGQVFDIVIKETVRLRESPAAGLSIMDYDPRHDTSKAYMALAEEVNHG